MKEDLIAVGDAIVAKISGTAKEDDDTGKNDSDSDNDNQKSKRKVKFGGVGDMLAKRRRS